MFCRGRLVKMFLRRGLAGVRSLSGTPRPRKAFDRGPLEAAGFVVPRDQDLLLSDVCEDVLKGGISDILKIPYGAAWDEAKAGELWPIHGVVFGRNHRLMFAAHTSVSRVSQALGVHFLLDTRSPWSYVSANAFQALGLDPKACIEDDPVALLIHGVNMEVNLSPKGSHFEEVNIAGCDFLKAIGAQMTLDFPARRFSIQRTTPTGDA